MGARGKYEKGEVIGRHGIILIEETNPISYSYGKIRMAIFKCVCGDEFTSRIDAVKSGHTNSCGCYHKKELISRVTTHGKHCHRLYKIWSAIKAR